MTKEPTKPRPLWMSLLVNMLSALIVVSLVQAFLVKVYRVPSASMEQTLQATDGGGDRMLVNRTAYFGGRPSHGDVVVFTRPDSWASETPVGASSGLGAAARAFGDITGIGVSNEQYMVKRVIAIEGDKVSCCSVDGKLEVNDTPLDEPYIFENYSFVAGTLDCASDPRSLRCLPEYTIPAGQLLVLGDHRSQSSDSAFFCRTHADTPPGCMRPVPTSSIVGSVFLRIWPLNRIGTLS